MNESASQVDETKKKKNQNAALRILDANANRSAEALRVVEEYCRFAHESPALTQLCKEMRHDLADVLAIVPLKLLLQGRDSADDVGAQLATEQEYRRGTVHQVAVANCKRLEQSLRALEEYGKIVSAEFAQAIEALRYRAYELSKRVALANHRATKLQDARLYLLLDGRESMAAFSELVADLLPAVDVIQLRDKQLNDRQLLERAHSLRQLTVRSDVLFIVNDRPDIATLADADGVHVGQEELQLRDVRSLVGADRLVGVSTHDLDQAKQAQREGADYIGCGPVFASGTKMFQSFPGVSFLRQVHGEISIPAFAIGGVDLQNIEQVCGAGFDRAAVSGAVLKSQQPQVTATSLRKRLQEQATPQAD